MKLNELLLEFGQKVGIPRLALDESGIRTLKVNDHYFIAFESSLDNKGFFIYAVLETIPSGEEERMALQALRENMFGHETGRASIGYDDNSRSLVLFDYLDEETTDFKLFWQRLEQFISRFEALQAKHAKAPEERATSFAPVESKGSKRMIFYA